MSTSYLDPSGINTGFDIPVPAFPGARASSSSGGRSFLSNASDLLGVGALGVDIFNSATGRGGDSFNSSDALEELESRVERYEKAVLDLQQASNEGLITGVSNPDYVSQANRDFFDYISDAAKRGRRGIAEFEPDLDRENQRIRDNIMYTRDTMGLKNSDYIRDVADDVIDVNPRAVYPEAIDFSPETGYTYSK